MLDVQSNLIPIMYQIDLFINYNHIRPCFFFFVLYRHKTFPSPSTRIYNSLRVFAANTLLHSFTWCSTFSHLSTSILLRSPSTTLIVKTIFNKSYLYLEFHEIRRVCISGFSTPIDYSRLAYVFTYSLALENLIFIYTVAIGDRLNYVYN